MDGFAEVEGFAAVPATAADAPDADDDEERAREEAEMNAADEVEAALAERLMPPPPMNTAAKIEGCTPRRTAEDIEQQRKLALRVREILAA